MRKVRIMVMRKACYRDLMEKYENPIEHACDVEEGQVFIAMAGSVPMVCARAHGSQCPLLSWGLLTERRISMMAG